MTEYLVFNEHRHPSCRGIKKRVQLVTHYSIAFVDEVAHSTLWIATKLQSSTAVIPKEHTDFDLRVK
jgi:hypothetical protein